jgi:hypothetical protein
MPRNSTTSPFQEIFPMDSPGEQYTSENVVPQENFPQDVVHSLSPGNPYGTQENSPFSLSELHFRHRNSEDSFSPISTEDFQQGNENDIGSINIPPFDRIGIHGTYTDRSGSCPGMSASDWIACCLGQGYAAYFLQAQPGHDQLLDQYSQLSFSQAQPPVEQLVDGAMNGQSEYSLFGDPSPAAISYLRDREPYSQSPDDTNESLSPPNGRTHANDPEAGIRTDHQPNLSMVPMEINAACSRVHDRQSLTGCTGHSVAEEGHVSP